MPTDNENFFQEQKDWSTRKLQIIESYLDGFSKILGSSTSKPCVYYVDGFAGRGIYDDGTKGSPVRSFELAKKYDDQQKYYRLNCINIEEDKENYSNLVDATREYGSLGCNLQGSFSSNIDHVLSAINGCPALFFIDPFGVVGTDWENMCKIIRRQSATDLWLRFDHITVRRLCGFFDSGSRGADKKVQRLLSLYGMSDSEQLFNNLDGDSPDQRIENAVGLYTKKLETEFTKNRKLGYSAAFPIISLGEERKYYLVFAAAHPKAVILASNVIYSVERNRGQERQAYLEKKTGQMYLFPTEPSDEEISTFIMDGLSNDIWDICNGEELNRITILIRLLSSNKKKWFGRFSESQFNKVLKRMRSEQDPRILRSTGADSNNDTRFLFSKH